MPISLTEIEGMDAFAVGDRSRKVEVPWLPGPGVMAAALGWIVALSAPVELCQQGKGSNRRKANLSLIARIIWSIRCPFSRAYISSLIC